MALANDERLDQPSALLLAGPGGYTHHRALALGGSLFSVLGDVDHDGLADLITAGDTYVPEVWTGAADHMAWSPTLPGSLAHERQLRMVADLVVADFDGDLLDDVFVLRRGEYRSEVRQLDPTTLKLYLAIDDLPRGVYFEANGPVTFGLQPGQMVDATDVVYGSSGATPADPGRFTLDPADPDAWGLPGVPSDDWLAVGFDPVLDRWTLLSDFPENERFVTITAAGVTNAEPIGYLDPDPTAVHTRERRVDTLLLSDGGPLTDRTIDLGLLAGTSCWSATAGDFDNDTDVDLYLVCSDIFENLPNRLFENLGDGELRQVPGFGGAAGPVGLQGIGDSVAMADYDADGFLDLYVTSGRWLGAGPTALLRNVGNANHWLEVDLRGVASNIDGIGAVVEISAGGTWQRRLATSGVHHRAQNHPRLHFGLGAATVVDELVVTWPSGQVDIHTAIPADQIVPLTEGG